MVLQGRDFDIFSEQSKQAVPLKAVWNLTREQLEEKVAKAGEHVVEALEDFPHGKEKFVVDPSGVASYLATYDQKIIEAAAKFVNEMPDGELKELTDFLSFNYYHAEQLAPANPVAVRIMYQNLFQDLLMDGWGTELAKLAEDVFKESKVRVVNNNV